MNFRVQKGLPLIPSVNQMNPVHNFLFSFFKIGFDTVLS
jgi:hypothetical protein